MEDAYISDGAMPGLPGWTFFAVLDGHAGKVCAEVAAEQLSAYAPKCRRHIYIYIYIYIEMYTLFCVCVQHAQLLDWFWRGAKV